MIERPERKVDTIADEANRHLPRLERIAGVLKELGFKVVEDALSVPGMAAHVANSRAYGSSEAFPIVQDGVQGIRIVINKQRGIIVSFTNGFEDPDNPRRKAVEARLETEGLLHE